MSSFSLSKSSLSPSKLHPKHTAILNKIALDLLEISKSRGPLNTTSFKVAFSEIEKAILNATQPIELNETEEIEYNGQKGILANKKEIVAWKGSVPIKEYKLNEDPQPEVIVKQTNQILDYQQEIAVRYLRPPTPPPPGEIIIRQERNKVYPPAPPLVLRQQPPRPHTPTPLVIREAPPKPPQSIGVRIIKISGKKLPPPPRKVVVERLPPLPSKPQPVIVERWLPYKEQKRKVILVRPSQPDPIAPKPKNVIIQWESPKVVINKKFEDLGIVRADPIDYVHKYGSSLRPSHELPTFAKQIKPPKGIVLAADKKIPPKVKLEGDIHALELIDLDKHDLAEYRDYLNTFKNQKNTSLKSDELNKKKNDFKKLSTNSYSLPANTNLVEIHEYNKQLKSLLIN
jgi:hypothetical protein